MDFLQSSLRNFQGVAKLSVETADLLIDLRQDAELSILRQIKQAVGDNEPGAQFVARGIELTTLAVNRQHALERDLLARLNEFIIGAQTTSPTPGARRSTDLAPDAHAAAGEAVFVTAHVGDGPLVMPLKLRNHHDTPQTVTLRAAKLAETDGLALPLNNLHFHPARLILAPASATSAYLIIEIDPHIQVGTSYWTEIRIDGSDPRRFPLCFTLLPAHHPEEGALREGPPMSDDVEQGT